MTEAIGIIGIVVVVACFVLGGAVMVAGLMHMRRQPVTDLRETVTIPGSLRLGDIQAALERLGWQVTDRERATGEIAGYVDFTTVVEAPQRGDAPDSLLFVHRRSASTAPCLLRTSLRQTRRGWVADLSMRGWGDGFINAWFYRRRFRSASNCVAELGRRDAAPTQDGQR